MSVSELLPSGEEADTPVISNDTLRVTPGSVLYQDSDILRTSRKSTLYINPLESVHGRDGDPGRHGAPWAEVLSRRNIGSFGHVVLADDDYHAGDIRKRSVMTVSTSL